MKQINIYVDDRYLNIRKYVSNKTKLVFLVAFGAALVFMNLIRIFDNCFWGDECFAIDAVHRSFPEMLKYVADEGHTPFYYVFLWGFTRIFGFSGPVYHLSGILPYIIIVVLTLTVIRKWFGNITCFIFLALSSLLECAQIYNLEVRMYAWCELFILLVYLFSYRIYKSDDKKKHINSYVCMSLFGMLAVYGHYFALGPIGLMYAVLLGYKFFTNKKDTLYVIASGLAVLVLSSPWFIYCSSTQGVVMRDYNMESASLIQCLEFIFLSRYSKYILLLFFILSFIVFLYETRVITFTNQKNEISARLNYFIDLKRNHTGIVWALSGYMAVFGTIIAALLISKIMYPILNLRYVYISYGIIWLLFGVVIQRFKLKRVISVILVLIICFTCIPTYIETVKLEREADALLAETLELTAEIDSDDMIYTDNVHFNWTVEETYYPETDRALFVGNDVPEMNPKKNNWMFLDGEMSPELVEVLYDRGWSPELFMANGYDGVGHVWIYKIVRM